MGRFVTSEGPSDRFWAKVAEPFDVHNNCWEWQGWIAHGYGRFYPDNPAKPGRFTYAHRWSYQFFNGPIPDDLELDHLCRNKRCVNPSHLEAVPHAINMARSPLGAPEQHRAKTHCKHGHPFSGENLYVPPTRRQRCCRECVRLSRARYIERKKRCQTTSSNQSV